MGHHQTNINLKSLTEDVKAHLQTHREMTHWIKGQRQTFIQTPVGARLP